MSFCASNRIRVLVPIIAAFCFLSSIDIAVAQTGGGTRAVCPTTFSTNTDCGYIITIGPRGSISGAAVPNANPYDGSDDALVGVINNSGLPYTGSFTITASYGSGFLDGVFDFEGDGICRYIGPGGFQPSPAGNYCTASQASGTDPGDYGGPGVTFSNITTTNPLSRQDTGTVNIAGLAAGGTTFFSLEGPPASIVFPLAFPNVNIGTFQAGSSISFTATALGGTAPYTFSTTGTLPQGITVNGATITGTAGQTGTFTINFVVTDASASTARGTITYSVSGGGGVLNVSGVDLGTVAQGQSISASISVSGGSPPLIFSTAGATPPGITVNGPTVSGTPTQTGDYDIGIAVKDSTGASGSASVTFSVFGFTGTALSPGITFSPYIASVGVAGGTPPYNFSFSGLPAGLSGNSSGTIDGAVQTPVTSQVSVRVADNSGVSISRTFTLTFTVPPPLSVPSQTLPAGQISSVYSQALSAMGGAPPYNWTIASGTLPAGLNLRPTGVVAGLPSQYGTFSFGVRATDVTGASGVGSATLVIAPLPLTITTGPTSSASAGSPPAISASLASAVANIEYPTQMISAFGGVPPYSFSVSSGALPPGVMLDPTGLLSGTPTSPGSYTFTVTATDSSGGASATIGASGLQPRAPGSGGVSGSATFTVSVRSLSTDLLLSASGLSFALIAGNPTAPPAQIVAVQSTNTAIPISYSVSVSPSSATWLSVSPAGGTTPGTLSVSLNNQAPMLAAAATPYQATVSVACLSPAPCAGNSQQFSVSVSVTSPPPMLSVSSDVIAFTTPSTAPAAMSQGVTLQNTGSGTVGIASISCAASWCTVGAAPGSLSAGPGVTIPVTADPTGLNPGFYRTTLTIKASTGVTVVPVTLFIANGASLSLSPSGALYQSVVGGMPNGPATSFLVDVNTPTAVNFTATVLPGASWLSVANSGGSATASQPGMVNFSIDPGIAAGLSPQPYYGTIRVTGAGLVNSPQDFEIVLNVAKANAPQRPNPSPSGLLFISGAAAIPPAQSVTISTDSTAAANFQVSASTNDGANWLSATPNTGTAAPGAAATTQVSVNPSKLAPGVYYGGVNYAFAGAAVRTVNVTLIVTPSAITPHEVSRDGGCTPKQLVTAQTGLLGDFAAPAAWPTPISMQLLNDCANPVINGQIVATFSNGDPPLPLSLANMSTGLYSATWTPRHTSSQVAINAKATAPGLPAANAVISGAVTPNAAPLLTPNGTLNIYNPLTAAALAPGTLVQISGTALSSGNSSAMAPLPNSLSGTSVVIGGLPAALSSATPGLLTAEIPTALAPGMQYQVIVSANGALTTPMTIQLSGTDPGVSTGMGGLLTAYHASGMAISESSPAAPGETIILLAAGLGLTDTPVGDGIAGPSAPLANALDMPAVTINNEAAVIAFAGLQPGAVGLYQVNVQVPADAANGDLTLILSQDGNPSNSAILPVKKTM